MSRHRSIDPSETSLSPIVLLALISVSACATASGSAETSALRDEVSILRQTHEADQKRIQTLETEIETLRSEDRTASGKDGEMPADLQVIHLSKPGSTPPPLATAVTVREPSAEEIAQIAAQPPMETGDVPRSGSPEEADALFTAAFEKLKTGELVRATSQFQEYARRFPHNPNADNALLNAGIAQYGLRQYQEALVTFRSLIKRYPAGDAIPEAMYREANCADKLGHRQEARTLLQQLKDSYPRTAEAARADRRLGELATNEGGSR